MKRFLTILFIFSGIILYARPKLQFVNQYVVMDTVNYEQKEVLAEVAFVNNGDEPLYITDKKAFCPCMHVTFDEAAVLPNDTAYIHVKYTFYHDEDYRNPVWIYYNTDNPDEFESFYLLGYVRPKQDILETVSE